MLVLWRENVSPNRLALKNDLESEMFLLSSLGRCLLLVVG